jgi:hypothetical protein
MRDEFLRPDKDGIIRRAEISVSKWHNHGIARADILRLNRLLPSVKKDLQSSFEAGLRPVFAKKEVLADLKTKISASSSPSKSIFFNAMF